MSDEAKPTKIYASGGIITGPSIPSTTTSPPGSYTWPAKTSPAPIWTSTTTTGKSLELVDLPRKTTRKVLIAFLDENDDPVWAKKLVPINVNMQFDNDGEASMTIDLSLIKYFDD